MFEPTDEELRLIDRKRNVANLPEPHPRNLYLGTDVHGNEIFHKGREVTDPTKSMFVSRSLVKGKSKKGKYLAHSLLNGNSDVDTRLDAPTPPKYHQPEPMLVAPKHSQHAVKCGKVTKSLNSKHVRLSQRVG